ncbi:MAG TPA: hypothetical protein VLT58_10095 [Polyangia bacterium]|nr:hypothetical protein [Polyangia bacterium]
MNPRRRGARALLGLCLTVGLGAIGCVESRDLGSSVSHGKLPVDERNPVILANDSANENWQGEYAILLSAGGGPKLAGLIVNTSGPWPDIDANIAGWRGLVAAARASGIRDVPDPIASIGPPLVRPADGRFASTTPNRSEGARLIVDASTRLSLPYRPLVVVTGGRLTDVADAVLIDPTIVDRIVVVSSMGTVTATGGAMSNPNGEMDPWADAIVTGSLPFVQVSAYYDQFTLDVPASSVAQLPANPFGDWIAAKQPNIWTLAQSADQVGIIAVGVPGFAMTVERVAAASTVGPGASAGPDLATNMNGPGWLVTQSKSSVATARFWQILKDSSTYSR